MALPTTKTPPQIDLSNQTILIYGRAKSGKSGFCAEAESTLFLATEAGLNHLSVYQIPILSWDDLLTACADIAAGDHPFKVVVIDTIDNCYKLCSEYVCRVNKVSHESELGDRENQLATR